MAEKKIASALFALIKNTDSEEIREVSESDLSKFEDPTKVELFMKEEDATKRKSELAFARITRQHQLRAAKAKVARQRAAFAKANPETARELRQKSETTLLRHRRAVEKSGLDMSKLDAAIAALQLEADREVMA